MSKSVNRVSERSERSYAERCGASERSEWCEQTNIASERPSGPFNTRLSLTRNAPKEKEDVAIAVRAGKQIEVSIIP